MKTIFLSVLLIASIPIRVFPFGPSTVVLRNFQATTDGRYAKLVWELAEMQQEVTCILERSQDGMQYVAVETYLIKEGFRGQMSASDKELLPGVYYYRLRMVKTGFIPYVSPVVSVKISEVAETNAPIKVITPFRNQITLVGNFSGPSVIVEVADLNGRIHMTRTIPASSSSDRLDIDATPLMEGTYILRIRDDKSKGNHTLYIRRIIKRLS